MEKMTLVEALDKRALLEKRINSRINAAGFVEWHKHNEARTAVKKQKVEEFEADARSSYQSIIDLIAYYDKLNEAISKANAENKIETSIGEMSIAAAIAHRDLLRENSEKENDFFASANSVLKSRSNRSAYGNVDLELELAKKIERQLSTALKEMNEQNQKNNDAAETLKTSFLGKDKKEKKELAVTSIVDAYLNENKAELIDPIGAEEQSRQLICLQGENFKLSLLLQRRKISSLIFLMQRYQEDIEIAQR